MDIQERRVRDVVVLAIRGDITMDHGGASRLADVVRRHLDLGRKRLLLDLSHVRYVDSAGLGEMVQALVAARHRGGALKLLHVTDRLNDMLILTRLLTVFDCFDEEAEAIDSFTSPRERINQVAATQQHAH
jgi:anti-sigma B factor antagonist